MGKETSTYLSAEFILKYNYQIEVIYLENPALLLASLTDVPNTVQKKALIYFLEFQLLCNDSMFIFLIEEFLQLLYVIRS